MNLPQSSSTSKRNGTVILKIRAPNRIRLISPLLPYFAVAVGLYGFRSAWVAMGAYHAGALAFALSNRTRYIPAKRSRSQTWVIPTAFIFAMGGVIFYFVWPYLNADQLAIGRKLSFYGVNKDTWLYIAVYFCLVNASTEEFFWRGYLGTETTSPVLNDFFFAGYHAFVLIAFTSFVWTIPVVIACAFAGWLWRMMRMKSGGMLIPVVTHILADTSIMIAVHLRLFSS